MIKINFINELKKLRESSKYAVAQGNMSNLDEFKQYLHIERPVENTLKHIILNASTCNCAQLILVCGNVGDGKSHVLSYLNSAITKEIQKFIIHNDATESHNPTESSNDTLYRVLNGFKDEHIKTSKDKIILAINLGTLSKFLEVYEDEFTVLKDYVNENKILGNVLVEEPNFDENQNLHHVNFTDYHLYSLSNEGAFSEIITDIFQKIINPSPVNTIYQSYTEYKHNYKGRYYCPILYNYEFLFNDNNRKALIQLIVKSIIKSKEIVSVRTLLNYIYDVIVPFELSSIASDADAYNMGLDKFSPTAYLALLIPNHLFEHEELSKLFDKISQLDPCSSRREELDSILLKLANTEKPRELFEKMLDPTYLKDIYEIDNTLQSIARNSLAKFFVRLNFFCNHDKLTYLKDDVYDEYVEWLFHFNCNNPAYISKVYKLAITAIKRWNGDPKSGDDKVIIKVGKKQSKYRIFKEVSILPKPNHQPQNTIKILHRFMQEFSLYFTIDAVDPAKIDIDFSLFKLLKKIENGYRPNRKDNNDYVYFSEIINKIINRKEQKTSLYIDEVNVGKSVDYKLSKEMFDGYKFELL